MATVSQTIPNYYGGLSEQPDELKIPGQVNKLINTIPDITHGLLKRPGGKLIGGNMGSVTDESKWFHYYRDENEQYMGQLKLSDGTLKMWALTRVVNSAGTEIHAAGDAVGVVYDPTDETAIKNYLKQTSDADVGNIQTLTLNDSTYITNRTVDAAMKTTVSPVRPPEAYIELKKVAYASQYSINLFDDLTTTEIPTATRLEISDAIIHSGNACYDAGSGNRIMPSSGNLPGSSGSAECNADSGSDNDDDRMPNVGTKIFAIAHGASGDADDANGTAHTYDVTPASNTGAASLRKQLHFRLTVTGQPVAGSNHEKPIYNARYTVTHDLLYGGEGWRTGDYFYIWFKNAKYKITVVQDSIAQVQCNLGKVRPDPTSFDTKTAITAESILGGLRTQILGDSNGGVNDLYEWKHDTGNDYHVQQIGNGLYISRPTSEGTFNLNTPVADLLNVFTGSVKDVADLPSQCKHGYIVRIANSVADEDDYYVKFIGSNERDGEGVWEECPEPGRKVSLDPATMPVTLIRTADGNFRLSLLDGGTYTVTSLIRNATYSQSGTTVTVTLNNHGFKGLPFPTAITTAFSSGTGVAGEYTVATVTNDNVFTYTAGTSLSTSGNCTVNKTYSVDGWEDCLVGDDITVPEPSFIGKGINKMLFFRNRMVLLSDENVIMSRPGDFFNFWPKTAVTFTATDNVDISCSSEYPAIVYDGIQVNTGLLLFTKNQQFMLTTDSDVLSPNTAKINALATYNFNFKTNPISMGTTVAFLDNAGKYARFFEITAVLREGQPEVLEQTKPVSKSFPKDINIIANSRENSVIFFAKQGDTKIYAYRYFSGIERRLQQAWFQWELSGAIQHMAMLDDALYAVIRNKGADVLQKFSIKIDDDSNTLIDDQGTLTDDSDDVTYRVHLDNAVVIASSALTLHSSPTTTSFACPTGFNKTNLSGTYTRALKVITVTSTAHEFTVGQRVNLEFTTGGATDGEYTVLTSTANTFTVEDTASGTISSSNVTVNAVSAAIIVADGDDKTLQGVYGKATSYTDSGTRIRLQGNWKTYQDASDTTITPTNNIIFGYLFDMEVGFPTLYRQERGLSEGSYRADVHSTLILHRVKFSFGPLGVYDVIVKKTGKDTYTETFEALASDAYVANTISFEADKKVTIPIYEKNINLDLTLKSTHPSPSTLYSLTWEGDYTDGYYKRV